MKRSTLYSIVILVVLAIATLFVLNREGEVSSTGSTGKMLVDYDSTAVDKLELISPSSFVVLEKQAGTWMLTSPIKYKADETSVTSAIGKGRRLELRKDPVSTNSEKQRIYQVDSTGTLVKVYEKGSPKGAFYIGKASSSFTETYVRLAGSNEVQLTNEMISSYFNKPPKDWRDKSLFKMDEGTIKTVRFSYGDTTFALSLQDSLWRIEKDSANQTAVKPLLSALASIQTDEFVDSALIAVPKLTAIIEVEGTQIRFFKKDDTKYLVQTSRSPQWFELQNWRATNLLKRKKDLLPTKL
jgi:hypothetical protein